MCTTCGCGSDHGHHHHHHHDHHHGPHDHAHPEQDPARARTLRIERALLAKNARLASANRSAMAASRIAVFNLIGTPGAGKTALLEATIRTMRGCVPLFVLEGDQATDRDAQRIERAGAPVVQINTGTGCHLDAEQVASGIRDLGPPKGSVVFIENVGNLVCPALFDLGEHAKVTVMSVTEGEDKPLKYPHVFRAASLFVLTKIDLAPHVDFDADRCIANAIEVNPRLEVLRVSSTRGDGIGDFCRWVEAERTRASRLVAEEVVSP